MQVPFELNVGVEWRIEHSLKSIQFLEICIWIHSEYENISDRKKFLICFCILALLRWHCLVLRCLFTFVTHSVAGRWSPYMVQHKYDTFDGWHNNMQFYQSLLSPHNSHEGAAVQHTDTTTLFRLMAKRKQTRNYAAQLIRMKFSADICARFVWHVRQLAKCNYKYWGEHNQ